LDEGAEAELMGDFQGHPFRGNQWTDSRSGGKTEGTVSRGDYNRYAGVHERGSVPADANRPSVAWQSTPPTPAAFIAARNDSKHAGFLSPLTEAELDGSELHLSKDGKVGYVITKDGDFGNLFNNGGPKGAGQTAMIEALESGKVKTADCFNGYLPELYANFGLVATGATKFDDEQAPPGWNHEKDDRPDVIFLAFTADPKTIRDKVGTFGSFKHPRKWDDYDTAKAESKRRAVASRASR
jgi:hypothetical protein